MNKEEIYDSQISPLMTKIIQICKDHKIAMIMSFALPTDEEPGLSCSTALLNDEYEPTQTQIEAYNCIIRHTQSAVPLMIATRNQDGDVVESIAIV